LLTFPVPPVLVVPEAFAVGRSSDAGDVSAHVACAHRSPDRAICSPGWTGEAQTPQLVAYFAVIGTGAW
jgi:hypothetical protein